MDLSCRVVYRVRKKYSFCNNKRLVFKPHSKYKIILFMLSGGDVLAALFLKERGVWPHKLQRNEVLITVASGCGGLFRGSLQG